MRSLSDSSFAQAGIGSSSSASDGNVQVKSSDAMSSVLPLGNPGSLLPILSVMPAPDPGLPMRPDAEVTHLVLEVAAVYQRLNFIMRLARQPVL